MNTHLHVLIVFFAGAITCAQAVAETADDDDTGWRFEVGIEAEREPAYAGSDVYSNEPGGDLRATFTSRAGHDYYISLGEIGANFNLDDHWGLSTVLEYEEGRENDDDPILAGFAEVEDTVEGQFALYRKLANEWAVGAVFQPDLLGRGKGLVYFVGVQNRQALFNKARLQTTWDVSFGDNEHMNTEFGVSAPAAAASGLQVFDASSGLKSTTLDFAFLYPISRRAGVSVDLGVEYYFSNAADSPLIEVEGSDLTYEVGIGLQFEF